MIPLRNWKYILIVTALMSAGFYAAWQMQGVRLEYAKSEISNLRFQIEQCQDATTANQQTIKNLQVQAGKINSLCSSRMKAKNDLIEKLKDIDGLKAPQTNKEEIKSNEKNVGVDAADDSVLHELNRMFDKADSKN